MVVLSLFPDSVVSSHRAPPQAAWRSPSGSSTWPAQASIPARRGTSSRSGACRSVFRGSQANRVGSPRPSAATSISLELPPESIDEEGWEERVAREVRHQELIEASFDRAEAHARLGDFEHALDWLDRVAVLSGGLPAAMPRSAHAGLAPRRRDSSRQRAIGSTAPPDRDTAGRADDGTRIEGGLERSFHRPGTEPCLRAARDADGRLGASGHWPTSTSASLGDRYPELIVIDGNDPRLIDVGVLSKLPLGAVTTWQHVTHPEVEGGCSAATCWRCSCSTRAATQRLTIFNTHLKSHFVDPWNSKEKRPRTAEEIDAEHRKANELRHHQADAIAAIVGGRERAVLGRRPERPARVAAPGSVAHAWTGGCPNSADRDSARSPDPGDPAPTSTAWTHRFKASGQPAMMSCSTTSGSRPTCRPPRPPPTSTGAPASAATAPTMTPPGSSSTSRARWNPAVLRRRRGLPASMGPTSTAPRLRGLRPRSNSCATR